MGGWCHGGASSAGDAMELCSSVGARVKKKFPWRKILKFGEHEGTIVPSLSAKNLIKTRSLAHKTKLMSAQKKGIYLGKSGKCI